MKRICIHFLLVTGLLTSFSQGAQAQSLLPAASPDMVLPEQEQPFVQSENQWVPDIQPPAALASIEVFSVSSGNWSDPTTWDCGCVPSPEADVTVMNGDSVFIDMNTQVVNLNIENGATLASSTQNQFSLGVSGDLNVNGSFQSGTSVIRMNGELPQQVIGQVSTYDISFEGAGGCTLQGLLDVRHQVFVSGSVVTNGQLTLKSNGPQSSASLAPILGGTIDGNIILERTITAPFTGWLTIGAPFTDATLEAWNDDFITTGFPGSDFPGYSFVSVNYFDETPATSEDSFIPVGDVSDLIVPGRGYYLYSNAGTFTFSAEGTPVTGSFDFPVTFTDHGLPFEDGLNLVANPYPSNIDWESEAGWTKSNLHGVTYVWDVGLNQFRTYANGFSVNGGTSLIRSGEAFWVHASGADPELTVNEAAKVSPDWEPELDQGDRFLKFRMTGLGLGDEIVIALDEDATENFDPEMDAYKFFSSNALLNLASFTPDERLLAINNIPDDGSAISVPVVITTAEAGEISIVSENIPNLNDRCIYFEDLVTGETFQIQEGAFYTFETEAVEEQQRFLVHFEAPISAAKADVSCFGANDGSAEALGSGEGPWDYIWIDGQGGIVAQETDILESSTITGLAPGEYSVTINTGSVCGALFTGVTIEEPAELTLESSIAQPGCDETSGSAVMTYSGGTEPLNIQWSNGETSNELADVDPGEYTFTVTDANGCSVQETVSIEDAPTVEAAFESSAQVINLQDGSATVTFTNNSINADVFTWDFGDGSATSEEAAPTHTYTEEGAFVVTLTAANDQCDDVTQFVIIVEEAVSVGEMQPIDDAVNVFVSGQTVQVNFEHNDYRSYEISAYNLLGQQLMDPLQGRFGSQQIALALNEQVPITLVTIRTLDGGQVHTFKIIR